MEIIGYSERGVMNALFYGIAYKSPNKKKDIDTLLMLAGLEANDLCYDYDIIMEASLSDFGDPDAIIIGKDSNGKETNVYFIEGKVSENGRYSLIREKTKFDNAMANNNAYKDFTSSLFAQLTLKYQLINKLKNINKALPTIITNKGKNLATPRVIGKNNIVLKIRDIIKDCSNAYYIAITPDKPQNNPITVNVQGGYFQVYCTTWVAINDNQILKKYISQTIEFNQEKNNNGTIIYDQINNK